MCGYFYIGVCVPMVFGYKRNKTEKEAAKDFPLTSASEQDGAASGVQPI